MKTDQNINQTNRLSSGRIKLLRGQGYYTQSEDELNELAFGHRLTFRLCLSVLSIGIITSNVFILTGMLIIAFLSIILPYHIFDYFYNLVVANRLGKPQLPRRSNQLKFACTLAVPWLGAIMYFSQTGQPATAYILGGLLMTSAFLVGFLDLCIPSMLYNALFLKRGPQIQSNS